MPSTAKKLADLIGGKDDAASTYNGTVVQVGSMYQVLLDGATKLTECTPEVKAVTGDRVTVEVRNHMARVRGNVTHPTTDDSQANEALTQAGIAIDAATQAQDAAGAAATAASSAKESADQAISDAAAANKAAQDAQSDADAANEAATQAIDDASSAKDAATQAAADASSAAQSASAAQASASSAQTSASNAQASARTAEQSATQAVADAGRAATAAESAEGSAAEASSQASAAAGSASDAASSAATAADEAARANQMANGALAGLSTLESVIDTVDWFATHKKASTDTTVAADKDYYTYDDSTGTLSKVEPDGTENPSQQGWYELDEAISNYVASHVATTNDGLYVVGLSNGWRVLVSTGAGDYTAGIFLIDPTGVIAQATTGTGTTFDSSRPYYIGDEDAYIVFDGDGGITIGGDGVSISGGVTIGGYNKTLSEVMAALNASISAVEYGVGNSATSHSDITSWSSASPTWEQGKYVWMRTTTNGLTYTYTCIQGAKGEQGAQGETGPQGAQGEAGPRGETGPQGTSVTVSKVEYGTSASASTQPSSWSTTVPTSVAQGRWLWVKTTYSDSKTATTKSYVGTDGEDGKSVYVKSSTKSGDTTTVVLTDGTNDTTLTIVDGEDGQNGTPGASGYVHTAWANSADGRTDFSTTVSANKTYLGVYTDNTQADSTDPTKYSWSLIKGAKGDTGDTGPQGPQGERGEAGENGKMLYGTCSTGASTTAKAVTCADATELYAGMTITVKFSTANTVLAPTLNVNSLGAKAIWVDNAVTSTSNCLFWNTNAVITFTYDGTQWLVADQPTTYYTTCSTAAGTAAKAAPCTAGVVRKGTTVTATMSYAHSSSTAATLYVTGQSGTARTIYVNGATVTSANGNSWAAGESVPFVFNGQYWYASRGEKGDKGDTPSITATKSSGVTTIKVDGTTIATVSDGEDGTTPTVTTRTNSDGSTTIVINGSDSATIENGTDGKSWYTYVRYSANSNGSGMVATPTASTKYIGVYTGESSTVPAYTAFTWSKYVGENGTSPDPLTVTSTATDYQLSTSGTTAPTGSWSTTPLAPTSTQYLWTRTTLTFSDSTSSTSYSVGGKAGTSVTVSSTVTTYASSTSGTTAPSSGWQSSVPSVAQGSYLWTKVVTTFSDGKTATSLTSSRQGKDGEQGQKGDTGPTGPEGVVTISVDSVDWKEGKATLRATLRVDGTAKTSGVTYKWTSGTSTTSLGTAQTLSVTNLNATYNCTCTW